MFRKDEGKPLKRLTPLAFLVHCGHHRAVPEAAAMNTFTQNEQRAIAAEFLGTMFFVFLGTAAVAAAVGYFQDASAAALVVFAIAHGRGILNAVAWTANISGGHINPAVTLGMLITK